MVTTPTIASPRNIGGIIAEAHMHSSMALRWPGTSIFQALSKHRSTLLQSYKHCVVFSWPKLTLGDLHSYLKC